MHHTIIDFVSRKWDRPNRRATVTGEVEKTTKQACLVIRSQSLVPCPRDLQKRPSVLSVEYYRNVLTARVDDSDWRCLSRTCITKAMPNNLKSNSQSG